MSALTVERPAADKDPSGDVREDVQETADQRQADYFVHLLTQRLRLVDLRIDEYQNAIAVSESHGDVHGACNFRRMARIEEHDRDTLTGMIERLGRRFLEQPLSDVPAMSAWARLTVR